MPSPNKPTPQQTIDNAATVFAAVLDEQLPESEYKRILLQRVRGFVRQAERALIDPPRINKVRVEKVQHG